jgi:23S rRNA pseudouridine955/2504/2580 synthase
MIEITIGEDNANQRIDKLTKKLLPQLPCSYIFKLFRKKDVKINNHHVDINAMVKVGDVVRIYVKDDIVDEFAPQPLTPTKNLPHQIIYEDENILVVNKPAGILTNAENKTSTRTLEKDVLSYLYGKGQYDPTILKGFAPAPLHRLDLNTSGVILFGKNLPTIQYFNALFQTKNQLQKYYTTLVCGELTKKGVINTQLLKDSSSSYVKVSREENSKEALTEYTVERNYYDFTLLRVKILTGRTHQIRVHMASVSHAVVNDPKYGDFNKNHAFKALTNCDSIWLHASELHFGHLTGKLGYLSNLVFVAPLPNYLEDTLQCLKPKE